MFARFKRWLERERARNVAWRRAWSDAGVLMDDGRTNFQHRVLEAVQPLVGPLTLSESKEGVGQYLTGPLPGTDLTLYLYVDEVQASGKDGFIAEKWDFDTPQKFADAFASFVRGKLDEVLATRASGKQPDK